MKIFRFKDGTTLQAWADDWSTDVGRVDWTLTLPDGKSFDGSTNFGASIQTDVWDIPYFNYRKLANYHYIYVVKVLHRWWRIYKRRGNYGHN